MIKVFVTGGTGLLGANLIKTFIESGRYKVMALRRSQSDMTLLGGLESKVEWIDGDVLDLESIEKGIKHAAIVFHCAAIVSFDPRDVEQMMEVNIEGTANIVNTCLDYPDIKLIHVSSIAALGHPKDWTANY
jgi:dihydroflavonol-4-reductase